MATGGTLPIKRVQTVSLYNTTGVIERDKNIYYSPLMSASAGLICNRWLTLFKQQCSSPTDYTDISISSWSPEDRQLKVKGNVDDFRLITEYGLALNYLILTRDVYKTEAVSTRYFYAFFITSVSQAGAGSVLLGLEPDHFTNVFYLHNKDVYSGEGYYDAFNNKMKNCYVERQHYDRVKVVSTPVQTQKTDYVDIVDQDECVDDWEEYEQGCYWVDFAIPKTFFPNDIDWSKPYTITLNRLYAKNQSWVGDFYVDETVDDGDYILVTIDTGSGAQVDDSINWDSQDFEEARFKIDYTATSTEYAIKEDNLPIFSQIEENFKFKRLVKDYKRQLNYGDMLTDEELEAIEEEDTFNNLSLDLQKKILKMCVAFLYVCLTDPSVLYGDNMINTEVVDTSYVEHYVPYYPNTRTPNYYSSICIPLFIIPDLFKKYNIDVGQNFQVKDENGNRLKLQTGAQTYSYLHTNVDDVVHSFLDTVANPYVLSMYISRESSLMENFYIDSVGVSGFGFKVNVDQVGLIPDLRGSSTSSQQSKLAEIIGHNNSLTSYDRYVSYNSANYSFTVKRQLLGAGSSQLTNVYTDKLYYGLFVNGKRNIVDKSKSTFNLDLTPEELSVERVTEGYYDTVLTFAPYDYWSISILGRLENILNKLNYYENPIIGCELSVMATDFIKYSFTPTYTISGLKQKYYSEGFEQTFSNSVAVNSNKLLEYVVANSSQMKSQYSVADIRNETELMEQYFTFSDKLGVSALRGTASGGEIGAISGMGVELYNQKDQFIGTVLHWQADRGVISATQKGKLADMGVKPSSYKQVGTDIYTDLSVNELGLFLNHYRIDDVSYNSICKYLERFGYTVNIYDDLHVATRVGWDFVQLASFDYETELNTVQEESIRQIFKEGVTLLHNKSVLTSGHNYEIILEGVINNE